MKIPKILIILLLALFLRIIFFTGFSGSDDYLLVKAADALNKGGLDFSASNHIPLRLALLYPVAFLINLIGINDFAISIFPLLCSLGIVLFTYLIGKKLFNQQIGLLAATLLSFFPLEVLHGSILVGEPIAEFFFLVGVYLLLLDKPFLSFLGGFSLGIAYLAKELYLLTFPFLLAYLWYRKKHIGKDHFFFSLGFITILLGEFIYFFSATGNFFYRQEVIQHFTTLFTPEKTTLLRELFLGYPNLTLNPLNLQVGLFFYLFYVVLLFALVKRMKPLYSLLIFTLFFFLYLNFGSASLTQYIPLPRSLRYFMLFSAPLALMSSFVLFSLKKQVKPFLIPFLLGILFLSSLFSMYFAFHTLYESASVEGMKQVQEDISSFPVVYVDQNNIYHLKYLFGFSASPQFIPFTNLTNNVTFSHTAIVVDRGMFQRELSFGEMTREDFFHVIEEKGVLVQEVQYYQKPGCALLTHFYLFQRPFFQQKLQLGCKKIDVAVYSIP